ncbi:MAG: DegV family protein [Eubacteriales bacterium]
MCNFKIMTDSNSDMPLTYLKENDVEVVHLSYMIDGETYSKDKQLESKDFYTRMRNGSMATTSQVNPSDAREVMESLLEDSKDILCISFSSALSGTYNSCRMAAVELMEERDDINIIVVDTLAASMGQGLLIHKAVEMRNAGKTIEEIAEWLETYKGNAVQIFTVDDLFHLFRGGRVSKTSAVVGTMINVKPILHVNPEGALVAVGKVRGRKKSLKALVDGMEERLGSYQGKNDIVFISHADALEDAEYVRDLVKEKYAIDQFILNDIGPAIGAHSGPGTVALFFFGDVR